MIICFKDLLYRRCCCRLYVNSFFIVLSNPLMLLLPSPFLPRIRKLWQTGLVARPKSHSYSPANTVFGSSHCVLRDYVSATMLPWRRAEIEYYWPERMYPWGMCIKAKQHIYLRKWRIDLLPEFFGRRTLLQHEGQISQKVCSNKDGAIHGIPILVYLAALTDTTEGTILLINNP